MPISDGLISARQLCTDSIVTRHISPDTITPTEVLTGFNFVELVTVLPTTGNFEGRMVYLTTDDKLYRHDGTAFLLAVDGADITAATISGDRLIANTITAGQIAAATITATELNVAQLDAITANMGTLTVDETITIGTSGVIRTAVSGTRIELTAVDDDKINFYNSGGTVSGTIGPSGAGALTRITMASNSSVGQYMRFESTNAGTDGAGFLFSAENMVTSGPTFLFSTTDEAASGDKPLFEWKDLTTSLLILDTISSIEAQLQATGGSAGNPSFSFITDTDTGMYRHSANNVAIVAGGTEGIRINATSLFSIGDAIGEFAIRHSSAGTTGTPAYSFVGDLDTGMYRVGADQIGFATGGSARVRIGTSFLIVSAGALDDKDPRIKPQGTTAAPAYTFRGDTDTGIYRAGVNQLGITVGGAARLTIDTVQIRATGSAHFVDAAPGATGTIDAQWINSGGSVRTLSEVTSMSSKKQDVIPLVDYLDTSKVLDLELIAFHMKDDPEGPIHIGTTAASVGKHLPALAYKRGGKWDFGQYSRLVIPLIAEVRKLRDRVDVLEAA